MPLEKKELQTKKGKQNGGMEKKHKSNCFKYIKILDETANK
jgi:hypothetical protein